jgi:hypothetical protein
MWRVVIPELHQMLYDNGFTGQSTNIYSNFIHVVIAMVPPRNLAIFVEGEDIHLLFHETPYVVQFGPFNHGRSFYFPLADPQCFENVIRKIHEEKEAINEAVTAARTTD